MEVDEDDGKLSSEDKEAEEVPPKVSQIIKFCSHDQVIVSWIIYFGFYFYP